MDSIVIAHPMKAEEALALLAEPAAAVLLDHDDYSVDEDRVVCTSDGETVLCRLPREAAARIVGHRITLELRGDGFGDGPAWFVSIRGRTLHSGEPVAGTLPATFVAVRVAPDCVRAGWFGPVGPSASHASTSARTVTA